MSIIGTVWVHPIIGVVKRIQNMTHGSIYLKYYSYTSELVSTTISPELPDPPPPVELDFDPTFYLNKYPDLVSAGYSTTNVEDHWLGFGIYEGRQGSLIFDAIFYLATYPDLQQIFGNDYYAAYEHWINLGVYEGRQGVQ